MMTKKDYLKITEVLKQGNAHLDFHGKCWARDEDKEYAKSVFLNIVVEGFCKMLAGDNPRFDRDKFKKEADV